MTLQGHNALCYANRAVFWLNVGGPRCYRRIGRWRLFTVVTMFPSAAVWPQFLVKVSIYKWPYLGNGE